MPLPEIINLLRYYDCPEESLALIVMGYLYSRGLNDAERFVPMMLEPAFVQ